MTGSVLTAAVAASLWILASSAGAANPRGPAPSVEHGRQLYEIYCMNCHGANGAGRGPAAAGPAARPTDLTRLAKRNGGSFPAKRVYRTIDGREPLAEHTPSSMPIWGLTLQELDRDTDQEDEVRAKILELIAYLESIQRR